MLEKTTNLITPSTEEEVAGTLREASQAGQKVRLFGGNTKSWLGNAYVPTDLAISTRQLDQLVDYQPEDLTITVGAGTTLARLQEILGEQGQFLPLDPPELDGQTLGGLLASNRTGPRRLLYGTLRDLLIGCRFVLADGSIGHSGGRVVKNVAGYDLHKLFIGSMGTLGLLTEVTFKVLPRPQVIGWGQANFNQNKAAAFETAKACVRSNLVPAALEVVGELGGNYRLEFGAEGVEVAVEKQLAELTAISKKMGALSTESSMTGAEKWRQAANRASLEQTGLASDNFAPESFLKLKINTTLSQLPGVNSHLESFQASLSRSRGNQSGKPGKIQAHAGTGVLHYYTSITENQYQPFLSVIKELRIGVATDGGSLVVEHAPPELKKLVDVWGPRGNGEAVMRALKQKFDPQGMLNPGVMDLAV